MQAADVPRALHAALTTATALGLAADDAIVLQDSNRITVRLRPSDVVARVADADQHVAPLELAIAQALVEVGSPVGALDPRVPPRVHEGDGFAITFWTYYDAAPWGAVGPADYAHALEQLHGGMRRVDVATPHFLDRVDEAQELVASSDRSLALPAEDREVLRTALASLRRAIVDRGAPEQLLHGEPHPGNVLGTADGPVFIDLETCCRGPVEFDLAHVPDAVTDQYGDVDRALLGDCRGLVLAMVTAWRLAPGDRLPNGAFAARALVAALRQGPPWPTLDAVFGGLQPS